MVDSNYSVLKSLLLSIFILAILAVSVLSYLWSFVQLSFLICVLKLWLRFCFLIKAIHDYFR